LYDDTPSCHIIPQGEEFTDIKNIVIGRCALAAAMLAW
jgi:hypothetical protein